MPVATPGCRTALGPCIYARSHTRGCEQPSALLSARPSARPCSTALCSQVLDPRSELGVRALRNGDGLLLLGVPEQGVQVHHPPAVGPGEALDALALAVEALAVAAAVLRARPADHSEAVIPPASDPQHPLAVSDHHQPWCFDAFLPERRREAQLAVLAPAPGVELAVLG